MLKSAHTKCSISPKAHKSSNFSLHVCDISMPEIAWYQWQFISPHISISLHKIFCLLMAPEKQLCTGIRGKLLSSKFGIQKLAKGKFLNFPECMKKVEGETFLHLQGIYGVHIPRFHNSLKFCLK